MVRACSKTSRVIRLYEMTKRTTKMGREEPLGFGPGFATRTGMGLLSTLIGGALLAIQLNNFHLISASDRRAVAIVQLANQRGREREVADNKELSVDQTVILENKQLQRSAYNR